MENVVDSTEKVLLINKEIIRKYYDAVYEGMCGNSYALKEFKAQYPNEYTRFSAVHRKRVRIKNCICAIKVVSEKIYFGTLTFNDAKDKNKITTKRKEAFKKLNSLFEYVLLVEEHGSDNNRYHIHFIGSFRKGKNFDNFVSEWHSRQNLREINDNENISQYLCKYLTKDLPRIRCNRPLVALEKAYKSGKRMESDKFFTLGIKYQVEKVHFSNSFDYEL